MVDHVLFNGTMVSDGLVHTMVDHGLVHGQLTMVVYGCYSGIRINLFLKLHAVCPSYLPEKLLFRYFQETGTVDSRHLEVEGTR